jgi:hypothetical protein
MGKETKKKEDWEEDKDMWGVNNRVISVEVWFSHCGGRNCTRIERIGHYLDSKTLYMKYIKSKDCIRTKIINFWSHLHKINQKPL